MARYIDADRFIVDMAENMFTDKTFHEIVQEQPTADVQPVIHGHWTGIPKYADIAWQCSECKHFTTMRYNYCPNCGAKMDKENKDGKVH